MCASCTIGGPAEGAIQHWICAEAPVVPASSRQIEAASGATMETGRYVICRSPVEGWGVWKAGSRRAAPLGGDAGPRLGGIARDQTTCRMLLGCRLTVRDVNEPA